VEDEDIVKYERPRDHPEARQVALDEIDDGENGEGGQGDNMKEGEDRVAERGP